jgi:fucose 4-O-acetylase-like acetyltransferase
MTSLPDVSVAKRQREQWVDNLRVLVIAGVIVVHTATGYVVDIAGWYYDDELTTSDVWSAVLTVPVFFGGVFALGPLFLVAGWFSVRSVDRRGPAGFARTRLLRLGVPLLAFVALLQPLTDYVGNVHQEAGSFVSYLKTTEVSVMWFAAALLVFSLVYAAIRHLCPAVSQRRGRQPGVLVGSMLAIAFGSFVTWMLWPLNEDVVVNLRFGAWPQGAGLFALGVLGARGRWLDDLPRDLVRRLGWTVVVATLALLAVFAVAGPEEGEDILMGANWPTLAFALIDGVIAVSFSLWCLAWLRRRWPTHGALVETAGRASYATYVAHPLVLTALMVMFAAVPLPPELKFVVVATVAVPACFAGGHALTRLPGAARVL